MRSSFISLPGGGAFLLWGLLFIFWPTLLLGGSVLDDQRAAILSAIRVVESSDGRDCHQGRTGELTCYQIKPATARLVKCDAGLTESDAAAAKCAGRVLDFAANFCYRKDIYGLLRFYNRGKCMRFAVRPQGYELSVAWLRLRFLIEAR